MSDLPKIQFLELPIEMEKEFFYNFLFKSDLSKYIFKRHPRIENVYKIKSLEKRMKFIEKYIEDYRDINFKTIKHNILNYELAWKKIEKEYFTTLAQIIDIKWPRNRKIIKAYLSINSICPRFLKDWTFTTYYNYPNTKDVLEVIMHECCHFLYFEKWKKIFPKMSQKRFESPYIEWHLSEIIAPIILNDKRIQRILKKKAKFYEEYDNTKIGNESIADHFSQLYLNCVDKMSFEKLLKIFYKKIKNIKI